MRVQRTVGGTRRRDERGAALVEFALLLPFLAILVCGVIDIGRFYGAWNEAKNAAREGAFYGQTFPNRQRPNGTCVAPNNIEDRVKQELGSTAVTDGFDVTITPDVP